MTEIDYKRLLEQINDKYAFLPDGTVIPREEYNLKCKEVMEDQMRKWGFQDINEGLQEEKE